MRQQRENGRIPRQDRGVRQLYFPGPRSSVWYLEILAFDLVFSFFLFRNFWEFGRGGEVVDAPTFEPGTKNAMLSVIFKRDMLIGRKILIGRPCNFFYRNDAI